MHRILHALATEQFATLHAAAVCEEALVRPFAMRKAQASLVAADEHTTHVDEAHRARVARLLAFNVRVDFNSPEAVKEAYAKLPAAKPRRVPVLLLVLCMSITSAFGLWRGYKHLTRPFAANQTAFGKAVAQDFGPYVAGVANGSRHDPEKAFRETFPESSMPAAVRPAMRSLFVAHQETARDSNHMLALYKATRDLNDALASAKEPYMFDARFFSGAPILYAFYKERETEASAPGFDPERARFVWRLDTLNIAKSALGYTHRESSTAIVLYDQVEDFLISSVLPALAEGERVTLIDDRSRDPKSAWQEDIEVRAARMVRESFAQAGDAAALKRMGGLLARRRAIVKQWNRDLATQGKALRPPRGLFPEADYVKDLHLLVPASSRREWEDIHEQLSAKESLETFERLRDKFARSVERHEIQHRFDAQRSRTCTLDAPCQELVIPESIRNRLGPKPGEPATLGTMPARVRDELSAYLAEMAHPGEMPKMTLLDLLPFLLDREAWGDAYCNTALVLFDSLSHHYGIHDDAMPLVVRGSVQRASVASLAVILFAKSDDDLRGAASAVWSKNDGTELPQITMREVSQGQRWRKMPNW